MLIQVPQKSGIPVASPRPSTKPATRKKGDIELLERIAKDPQAFIRQQGWASVPLDGDHTIAAAQQEELEKEIEELVGASPL